MSVAVAAALIARRLTASPAPNLSWVQKVSLVFGALVGGTLSAKLPYVLSDPEGAINGLAWLRDGRTITWGLPGAYFGVEFAKMLTKVRGKTGDGFAVPAAVSIGVGRFACFYAGCCFGTETHLPWGVDFGDGITRHPSQIYESLFHGAVAVALLYATRRDWFRFQRIKLFILAYMGFRFFSEFWRPEPRLALGVTFYQYSALFFFVVFLVLYWVDARRGDLRQAGAPATTPEAPYSSPVSLDNRT